MLKFKLNFGEKDKIASSLEQSELAKQAQIEPPQKGERLDKRHQNFSSFSHQQHRALSF